MAALVLIAPRTNHAAFAHPMQQGGSSSSRETSRTLAFSPSDRSPSQAAAALTAALIGDAPRHPSAMHGEVRWRQQQLYSSNSSAPSASRAARLEAVAALTLPRPNHAARTLARHQSAAAHPPLVSRAARLTAATALIARQPATPHTLARSLARRVEAAAASMRDEHQHAAAKPSGGAATDSSRSR
jgi:hypothetical protein